MESCFLRGQRQVASATRGWCATLAGKRSPRAYLFTAPPGFAVAAAALPTFEFFPLCAAILLSLTTDNDVSQPFQCSSSSSLQWTVQAK